MRTNHSTMCFCKVVAIVLGLVFSCLLGVETDVAAPCWHYISDTPQTEVLRFGNHELRAIASNTLKGGWVKIDGSSIFEWDESERPLWNTLILSSDKRSLAFQVGGINRVNGSKSFLNFYSRTLVLDFPSNAAGWRSRTLFESSSSNGKPSNGAELAGLPDQGATMLFRIAPATFELGECPGSGWELWDEAGVLLRSELKLHSPFGQVEPSLGPWLCTEDSETNTKNAAVTIGNGKLVWSSRERVGTTVVVDQKYTALSVEQPDYTSFISLCASRDLRMVAALVSTGPLGLYSHIAVATRPDTSSQFRVKRVLLSRDFALKHRRVLELGAIIGSDCNLLIKVERRHSSLPGRGTNHWEIWALDGTIVDASLPETYAP